MKSTNSGRRVVQPEKSCSMSLSSVMGIGCLDRNLTFVSAGRVFLWGRQRNTKFHFHEATFLKKVVHIRHRARKNKIVVQAGWYSRQAMKEKLSWKEPAPLSY